MSQKNEASACDAGPGVLLGGGCQRHSTISENLKARTARETLGAAGIRILKDRAFGHLVGGPEVIIERRKGSAFVSIRPRPWGWSNVDREFLNADSPGVDRYALALVQRIHEAGKAKHAEREQFAALRKAEREAAR